MAIIRSNNALVAFDYSNYYIFNNFEFLSYIQSFEVNFSSKRINHKSLGASESVRSQFVKPEILLNINFLQKNNLSNEILFGFNKILNENTYESFAKRLFLDSSTQLPFLNSNAFVIFNDKNSLDLISKIKNNKIDDSIVMSLGNLFINSYSFSYTINQLPLVSCSFLCSEFRLSRLIAFGGANYIANWNNVSIPLNSSSIDELISTSNSPRDTLVFLMQDFTFSNNFSSTSSPGPNIDNFLDGLIQSMDFSIDFNRSEFYFFKNTNDVFDRSIFSPIKIKLKINGISNKFEAGAINNFFLQDQKFSCSILMGDSDSPNANVNKLIFDSLCVENFTYTIDMNGMLNYSIECYGEITPEKGFRILEINKYDPSITFLYTSDEYTLTTLDNFNLIAKAG